MLKDILQSCQYRVSLRSLLPLPNPGPIYGEGNITISFMVVTGEGFGAICRGTAAQFTHSGRTFLTQAQNPDITEELLAFAQEYGWKTDS